MELEIKRLIKENNKLHERMIKEKEIAESAEIKFSSLYKKVEEQKLDYNYILESKNKRVKTLIDENSVLRTKIDQLLNQAFDKFSVTGKGKVAMEIRKKIGDLSKIGERVKRGLRVVPALNNHLKQLEMEFLNTRDSLRAMSVEKEKKSNEINSLKSGILYREKEIARLQSEIESKGVEKFQNYWLKEMANGRVAQQTYEVQVSMLEKENNQLKDDLEQVKNQRGLIDTLRREILAVRNEQDELKQRCQEQDKELAVKEELIKRLNSINDERVGKFGELHEITKTYALKEAQIEHELTSCKLRLEQVQQENLSMKNRLLDKEKEVESLGQKVQYLTNELHEERQAILNRNDQEVVVSAEISVLKKQINEKNKKLRDMKQEREMMQGQIENLQVKNKIYTQENDNLRNINQSSLKNMVPESNLREVMDKNIILNNVNNDLKNTISSNDVQIDQLNRSISTLTAEKKKLEDELHQKRQWLGVKDAEISSLKLVSVELEKERNVTADLKLKLMKAEEHIHTVKSERDDILQTVRDFKESSSNDIQLKSKTSLLIEQLEKKNERLSEELRAVRSNYEQTQNAVDILRSKLQETEARAMNKENQIKASLQQEITANKISLQGANKEIEDLSLKLREQKSNFKTLRDNLYEVQREFSSHKEEVRKINKGIEYDRSIRDQKTIDTRGFEMQNQALEKTVGSGRRDLEENNIKLQRTLEELTQARASIATLNETISQLRMDLNSKREVEMELKDKVEDYQNALQEHKEKLFQFQNMAERNSNNQHDIELQIMSSTLKERNMSYENELNHLKEEIENYQNKIIDLKASCKSSDNLVQQLKNQIHNRDEEINHLKDENHFLKEKNGKLSIAVSSIERERNEQEMSSADDRRRLALKQDTIEKLNGKLRELESVFEEANMRGEAIENELERKDRELITVEQNLKRVMLERDDYKNEIKALKGQNVKLRFEDEIERYRSQLNEAQKDLQDSREEVQFMRKKIKELERLKTLVADFEEERDDLSSRVKMLEEKNRILNGKLTESDNHLKDLIYEKQNQDNNEIKSMDTRIQELKMKVRQMESEKSQLIQENELLSEDLRSLRSKSEKLRDDLSSERDLNIKMEETINNLERHKRRASVEIERLRSQINQLKIQVEGHYDSIKYDNKSDYEDHKASFSYPVYKGLDKNGTDPKSKRTLNEIDSGYLKKNNERVTQEFESLLPNRSSRGFSSSKDPGHTH